MPRSSCAPCCNPVELARSLPSYRAAVLQILCMQSQTSVVTLCNEAGEPILVRSVFDVNGENPVVTAWNMDGTLYEGDIVACGA